MTDTRTVSDVEAAYVNMVRQRAAKIAADLRDMADDVDRAATDLDTPSILTVAPYGRTASRIAHKVLWGLANLNLDLLARDAAEADVYRAKGDVK